MADLVVIGYPDDATADVEINAALDADRAAAGTLAGSTR